MRPSEVDAVFLGHIRGRWCFAVLDASGTVIRAATPDSLGPVCQTSVAALVEGMPVLVRISRDGRRLLNWKCRGQDEPGFKPQEFMERYGLTYDTRAHRTDTKAMRALLGIDD